MTVLRFENVGKTYSGPTPVDALNSVTTEISQGDYVVIQGPSGAGKSTFLNVLALLDVATAGTYTIDQVDVGELRDKERSYLRSDTFSFVFQSFHLIPSRTVLDNTKLGLGYRGIPDSEAGQRALEALQFVGLGHKAKFRASQLSGGESQRVAIARAIATGAPVLVADEPTGNLDSTNSAIILSLLDRLNDQGQTIVVVTHDDEVAKRASRRLSVFDGVMREDTVSREVASSGTVIKAPGESSKVRIVALLLDAWASVMSAAGRSVGLILMVVLGVAFTLTTVGLAQTARYQVTDAFDANVNRRVSMFTDSDATEQQVQQLLLASGQDSLNRVAGIPGVEAVSVVAEYPHVGVKVRIDDEPQPSLFFGVFPGTLNPELFEIDRRGLAEAALGDDEVMVGRSLAKALDLGPSVASPTLWIEGQPFRVVGIINSAGIRSEIPNGVVVTENAASGIATAASVGIEIRTEAGAAQQVAHYAPLAWSASLVDDISVYAPSSPDTMRGKIDESVRTILLTLTVVSALAALLALTNSMATGVQRRTGEFGMRRAIGCRRVHLAGLVVTESTVIGLIGGLGGTFMAIMAILVVTITQKWQPVMDFSLIPYGVLGGVLVGIIGSLVAIRRAVSITPAEALRAH